MIIQIEGYDSNIRWWLATGTNVVSELEKLDIIWDDMYSTFYPDENLEYVDFYVTDTESQTILKLMRTK